MPQIVLGVIFSSGDKMWSMPACPSPDLLNQVWYARDGCADGITETRFSGWAIQEVRRSAGGGR